jgi:hypothetical protein
MPDQATKAPITDEELADAIRVRGRQVRNGIKVLQLILDHIPPETGRHCHINELSLPSFLPVPRFRGRTIGTPCVSRSRAARHRPSEHTMTA